MTAFRGCLRSLPRFELTLLSPRQVVSPDLSPLAPVPPRPPPPRVQSLSRPRSSSRECALTVFPGCFLKEGGVEGYAHSKGRDWDLLGLLVDLSRVRELEGGTWARSSGGDLIEGRCRLAVIPPRSPRFPGPLMGNLVVLLNSTAWTQEGQLAGSGLVRGVLTDVVVSSSSWTCSFRASPFPPASLRYDKLLLRSLGLDAFTVRVGPGIFETKHGTRRARDSSKNKVLLLTLSPVGYSLATASRPSPRLCPPPSRLQLSLSFPPLDFLPGGPWAPNLSPNALQLDRILLSRPSEFVPRLVLHVASSESTRRRAFLAPSSPSPCPPFRPPSNALNLGLRRARFTEPSLHQVVLSPSPLEARREVAVRVSRRPGGEGSRRGIGTDGEEGESGTDGDGWIGGRR